MKLTSLSIRRETRAPRHKEVSGADCRYCKGVSICHDPGAVLLEYTLSPKEYKHQANTTVGLQ